MRMPGPALKQSVGSISKLTAATFALLAVAGTASGFTREGRPWPGGVVRYAIVSESVRESATVAAKAWSTTGASVRFVEVPRSRAQLLIVGGARLPVFCRGLDGSDGCASPTGWPGPGRIGRVWVSTALPPEQQVITAAHELGHAIGLGHEERRCSVMGPSDYDGLCSSAPEGRELSHPFWRYVCRPPMDDDARGAAALYGGKPRRPARHTCVNDLGQKWISRFTVASPSPASGSLGIATVSWRLGSSVWEGLRASRPVAIVSRREDGCPETPGVDDDRTGTPPDRRDAVVGIQRYRVSASVADLGPAAGLPTGSYCYALWLEGRRVATATVRLPAIAPLVTRLDLKASAAAEPDRLLVRVMFTTPRSPVYRYAFVYLRPSSCAGDPEEGFPPGRFPNASKRIAPGVTNLEIEQIREEWAGVEAGCLRLVLSVDAGQSETVRVLTPFALPEGA